MPPPDEILLQLCRQAVHKFGVVADAEDGLFNVAGFQNAYHDEFQKQLGGREAVRWLSTAEFIKYDGPSHYRLVENLPPTLWERLAKIEEFP